VSLNLIPGRRHAKHRGKSGLELRRELAVAEGKIASLTAAIDQISAERNTAEKRADKTAIELAGVREDRDEWREQALALWNRFGSQIADEENETAVTVPPAYRDTTDPADQATAPIDVKPLWVALNVGPSTAVTDPGHVPSWAAHGETATQ
jgi:hypothetical protein